MAVRAGEIESRASALGEKYGIYDAHGWADVNGLVGSLGGTVLTTFDTPDKPESLQVRASDDFTIIVPWNTSHARDRFTVAHEIGHLVLHYDDAHGTTSFYRYGRSRQESEANAFAAALLMPAGHFEQVYARHNGDLAELAEHFAVSASTARMRAQSLGLHG